MESKYKIGQVVIIAKDLNQFEECEHRHLTETMKEAYGDLALIVDVKPAEGLTNSTDDSFNYSLKILRDRWYTQECEKEIWTSDLFEECTTPKFKINDLVHFTDNDQWDTKTIYRVDSYFGDTDDSGNLAVGYYLIDVANPNNEYYADAEEAEYLELVSVEQVTSPSLEGKLCCVKSDADIIADYNSHDVEFTKQLTQLQQKVEENENRLRKQKEFIAGSGRPGELGILNPRNQTRSRNPEASIAAFSIDSRKRVGFFED